jgi:transposase
MFLLNKPQVTGHYHRALTHYLQEFNVSVYVIHVQMRQIGLLKTDKRDALGLANLLYNQLEKGIQMGDPLQAVHRLVPPTDAAVQLKRRICEAAVLFCSETVSKCARLPFAARRSSI